ncbi:hypothetical protein, partial [Clostridioides difficile]|uniref:hypothetical protein n=1 Tax=Clostridioides difficile TaxID=1496 RepID=UPI002113DC04
HEFIIADVSYSIIGLDFLKKYKLSIDVSNKLLIDNVTNMKVALSDINQEKIYNVKPEIPQVENTELQTLINEHEHLFLPYSTPDYSKLSQFTPNIHSHIIVTENNPVFFKPRRISPVIAPLVKNELQ